MCLSQEGVLCVVLTITLHPGFFRILAVLLLVLPEISLEERAVRQLDGLVVAQVGET